MTNNEHRRSSSIQHLRERHEEWIRTIVQECIQHSKVNVFILQEMMYQGKILVGSSGGSGSGRGRADIDIDNDNDNNNEEYLKWIQRVLLPSTASTNDSSSMNNNNTRSHSSSSNAMHDSMSRKWETEMVPALVEAAKKSKARSMNHNNSKNNKNKSKSTTYATVIQQTKTLIKYLPSHWRSKAE